VNLKQQPKYAEALTEAAGKYKKEKDYWHGLLKGKSMNTTIAGDFVPAGPVEFQTADLERDVPPHVTEKLMEMSTGSLHTVHILLLAGLAVLLRKVSGAGDIVAGSAIYRQDENQDYSNTVLPLLFDIHRQGSFKQLVLATKKRMMEAIEHYRYPMEILGRDLGCLNESGNPTFFDVALLMENIQQPDHLSPTRPNMVFLFHLQNSSLTVTVEYNRALFAESTILRTTEFFFNILSEALFAPHMEVGDIQLMSSREKRRLLVELNQTSVPAADVPSIFHWFSATAQSNPDAVALVGPHHDQALSYGGLLAGAFALARELKSRGVRRGSIVGILSEPSLEMVTGLLAILCAGAAFLPLDPRFPGGRLEFMLNDSNASALLAQRELEHIPAFDGPLCYLEPGNSNYIRNAGNGEIPELSPEDLIYVIYTSGTTGKPKGVQLIHRNLLNYVSWFSRSAGLETKDRSMLVSSFAFDLGYTAVWPALLGGATLILAPKDHFLEADILWQRIRLHGVTYLKMTPSLFTILMGNPRFRDGSCRSLRLLVLGGEAMNLDDVEAVHQTYPQLRIMNHYGPTEATIGCVAHLIDFNRFEEYRAAPVIGKPIDNMKVFVVDPHNPRCLQPIGVAGELCLAGAGLARGYLNRPETTAEKFTAGLMELDQWMYRTGDLARRLENGAVQFLGRIDHQVKIRGFRIELREIEHRLGAVRGVDDAAVVVRRDKGGDPYLCAYLVWRGEGLDTASLRDLLAADLPDYMIPPFFMPLDKLPLTANNKLDRDALPEPDLREAGGYRPPSNRREEILVQLWAGVLGLDEPQIGVDANFFALGGQSLKATVLAGKIQKEFNVHIPLIELFKAPTIAGQALYIEHAAHKRHLRIPAAEQREFFPLSSAQKRLMILQRMEPQSVVYNRPRTVYLPAGADTTQLEEILRQLVRRHESLRTSFHWLEDQPVQRIHTDAQLTVQRHAQLDIDDFIQPFDLSQAPLARAALVDDGNGASILVVDMHHIIADGVSQDILVRDFAALSAGNQLPPLRIQYKEFALWQAEEVQQEAMAKQEDYWLDLLSGQLPELELPLDFPRPTIQSFEGRTVDFIVSPQTSDALKQLASTNDATLFMALMAVFYVMLHRLTGQEDILVGIPVAGRRHIDLEGVLGMFVNTLVMRCQCTPSQSFQQFLAEVRRRTIDAFDNQDCQFEDLVEKLAVQRDPSRNPLFDAAFNFLNYLTPDGQSPAEAEDTETQEESPAHRVAKFDLIFAVVEREEGLWFQVQYCAKLFKESTISRFISYYNQLAAALTREPGIALQAADMIPSQERQRILYDFNDTNREYSLHQPVHTLLRQTAERSPHAVALAENGDGPNHGVHRFLTYGQLDRRASAVALHLMNRGVAAGLIVAVMMEASLDWATAILGILKLGCAYLPIDPDYPLDRVRHMLDDSDAALLLEGDLPLAPGEMAADAATATGEDLAYVIYTSGSTGRPKGVAVEHRSLVNLCYWHARCFEVTSFDRAAKYAGLGFDASVWELFPYLAAGSALCIVPSDLRTDIAGLNEFFQTNHITISFLPTQICEQFMKQGDHGSLSLRLLLTGGDALREFHPAGYRLENNYGPTENTVVTTSFTVTEQQRNIPIGRPVDNCRVYILDPNGNPQPIGVPGQLCAAGNGLARGYLNQPELTHSQFVHGGSLPDGRLYKTGDRCRFLEDGTIEFLGRVDQQVKIRGFRIELHEIESVLLEHEDVTGAAVTVKTATDGDKVLVAYVVAAQRHGRLDGAAVKRYLGQRLPVYMIPPVFTIVPAIPLTANGKKDIAGLPEPDLALEMEIVPPATELESRLLELWAEVLNLDEANIGVTSNFFDLGGHSLKATALVTRIQRELQVDIPLVEVFRTPFIRGMALTVGAAPIGPAIEIQPLEKMDYYPLSSAQKRLYTLQQLDPHSTAYNIPQIITLPDRMEESRLLEILDTVIQRHDSLRTFFSTVDQQPVQRIHPQISLQLETHDLDTYRHFFRPFDLSRAPLLRVGLLPLLEGRDYLLVDMHHIISDGSSMEILAREFRALFSGESLSPLTVQYKDYAAWQRNRSQTEAHHRHVEYWLGQFSDTVPVLDLPADHARPAIRRFSGGLLGFELDQSLAERLETLAAERGATLFMVLLALFNLLLSRLCRQEDIVVGTPLEGRIHADLSGIIGMFVNTLALRNFPRPELRFADFLDEAAARAIDAFHHQEIQFDDLVERLQLPRDVSRNPVFDVMLTLQNMEPVADAPTSRDRDTSGSVQAGKRGARFDMSWTFVRRPEGLKGAIEYYDLLLSESTVKRFAGYFEMLARAVTDDPSQRLMDIDMVPPQERAALMDYFNGRQKDYPQDLSIPDFIRRQAKKRPHQIIAADDGVKGDNRQLTAREFVRRARSLAKVLRNHGAGAETIIALLAGRSLETLLSISGAMEAGGAYLPLDSDAPEERNLFIMKDCNAPLLVAPGSFTPDRGAIQQHLPAVTVVDTDADETWAFSRFPAPSPIPAGHLAYVIYTSGTTGKPKGVMVEHRSVVNLALCLHQNFYSRFGDPLRLAFLSPFIFDASLQKILEALMFGRTLVIAPKQIRADGEAIVHFYKRHAIDVSDGTPVHASLVAEAAFRLGPVPSVKCLFYGGDVLPRSVVGKLFSAFQRPGGDLLVVNVYGPTECTVNCAMLELRQDTIPDGERIPVGSPLDNYKTYILDPQLRPVPFGVAGELFLGGAGVARGYLNRGQLTQERFLPDPFNPGGRMYRSGDLARLLPGGVIDFLGRLDNQVKLRGYRIELGEIENCLSRHPAVAAAVAALKPDRQGEPCLCAYLVPDHVENIDIEAIREFLRQYVPAYMIPSFITTIPSIPMSSTNKVDRRRLPEPELAAPEYAAPESDLERDLTAIWAGVLGLDEDEVGVTANFFQLGGHSLRATTVAARVREQLGHQLPLVQVFQNPTVRSLAAWIERQAPVQTDEQESGAVRLRTSPSAAGSMILIHDGSGLVDGYANLCSHPEFPVSAWGLNAPPLQDLTPKNWTIPQLAAAYIRRIEDLDVEPPYHLLGWSLGGTVVFEMARQLEQNDSRCGVVLLVDSPGPRPKEAAEIGDFSLATERGLLHEYFPQLPLDSLVKGGARLEDFWPAVAAMLSQAGIGAEDILGTMPPAMAQLMPQGREIDLPEILRSLNLNRSLTRARSLYVPDRRLESRLHIIEARDSGVKGVEMWRPYCASEIVAYQVEGDHFSIMAAPVVGRLVELVSRIVGDCLL
jgi:amino acid adenylation domain-containing protein